MYYLIIKYPKNIFLLIIVFISFIFIFYFGSIYNKKNYFTQPSTVIPSPTPETNNSLKKIITNETSGWITCENPQLNISVQIPPKWQCLINKSDISQYNIYLSRPDGKTLAFLDVWPTELSSPFAPIPKASEGYQIGTITLNDLNKNIYIWSQRTQLTPIFEQFIYDQKKHQKNYLEGIIYIVGDSQLKQLSTDDRLELKNILSSVKLIRK